MIVTQSKVLVLCSQKDDAWKDRLITHIHPLFLEGRVDVWDDWRLRPGDQWQKELKQAIEATPLVIVLVSSHFLLSSFITDQHFSYILDRAHDGNLIVLPVLVSPCPWKSFELLKQLHFIPRHGRSLKESEDIDEHLNEVAKVVRLAVGNALSHTSPAVGLPLESSRVSISRLPVAGPHFFGREAYLQSLDAHLSSGNTTLLSIVAPGGVGKSALVTRWLERLAPLGFGRAHKVFAWSFYSQGVNHPTVSADLFIDTALEWFGDPDPSLGSPWEKGQRLTRLVREQPTLLILDGLEPLQHPSGIDRGALRDPALSTLLHELASENTGLCIVTTREPIGDLGLRSRDRTSLLELLRLDPIEGASLLNGLGVSGSDEQLRTITEQVGGHALALNLLGHYLAVVYGGNASAAKVLDLKATIAADDIHVARVLKSYVRWFGKSPESDLLHIIGLFDRPAPLRLVTYLVESEPIEGLTDEIHFANPERIERAIRTLREMKLLSFAAPWDADTLDTHPLIREFCAHNLRMSNPDAWRRAHGLLFHALQSDSVLLPDTMDQMSPLFDAVTHACHAGLHSEAISSVYWTRIRRGNDSIISRKLGAFSADLSVLSGFFQEPWSKVVESIDSQWRPLLLSCAGFNLRALGRANEAILPMTRALEHYEKVLDIRSATVAAASLSELLVSLGYIDRAISMADHSTDLAGATGDRLLTASAIVRKGVSYHQLGDVRLAIDAFSAAETIQAGIDPQHELLYSVAGFYYCEALLEIGEYGQVQLRASTTRSWAAEMGFGRLSNGLDELSLALVFEHRNLSDGESLSNDVTHFDHALDLLRSAGVQEFIAKALVYRGRARATRMRYEAARDDLFEALSIARRSGMKLHEADALLGLATCSIQTEAKECLIEASRIARECRYLRITSTIAALAAELDINLDDIKGALDSTNDVVD